MNGMNGMSEEVKIWLESFIKSHSNSDADIDHYDFDHELDCPYKREVLAAKLLLGMA